jgi:hypothetical protein
MAERGEIEDREAYVAEATAPLSRGPLEGPGVVGAAVREGTKRRIEVESSTSLRTPVADKSAHDAFVVRTTCVVSIEQVTT